LQEGNVRFPKFIAVTWLAVVCTVAPAGVAPAPAIPEDQRVLSAYGGVYQDPRLQAALTRIATRLREAIDRRDVTYRLTILNSPAINAFVLPSGQLCVTRGLLALANDRAEVAAAMSHVMAHVIARHAAPWEEHARRNDPISDALGESRIGTTGLARPRMAPSAFTSSQETEAYTIGIGTATRAGFDPLGAVRLFHAMERHAELPPVGADMRPLDFISFHPATPERTGSAQDSANDGARNRDRAAYLRDIDGMAYGDDSDGGLVRGRQFIHPRLGFTFMVPTGFIVDNSAQSVLGSKGGGNEVLRLDVVKGPADQSLIEFLNSGWIEGIRDGSVDELVVNGIPAATAVAASDLWTFRLYLMSFGGEVYRLIFAVKHGPPDNSDAANRAFREADRAFRASFQTFRRLLEREKSARPLHLKVVKVQPGDTVESLAGNMAFADHQVERFLVLNGLNSDELKVGDFVKIVIE
jgi:predicted Zn-dependent protease